MPPPAPPARRRPSAAMAPKATRAQLLLARGCCPWSAGLPSRQVCQGLGVSPVIKKMRGV